MQQADRDSKPGCGPKNLTELDFDYRFADEVIELLELAESEYRRIMTELFENPN